jgi:hypothetical protein
MSDFAHTLLNRRRFVQSATGVLTGVLSAMSPLAAFVPSRAWAVEMHSLSAAQATTLLAVIRTIVPHDGLDDAAYALVVSALDTDAAGSAESRRSSTGIADLAPICDRSRRRVAALHSIESSPFFRAYGSRRYRCSATIDLVGAPRLPGEAFPKRLPAARIQ